MNKRIILYVTVTLVVITLAGIAITPVHKNPSLSIKSVKAAAIQPVTAPDQKPTSIDTTNSIPLPDMPADQSSVPLPTPPPVTPTNSQLLVVQDKDALLNASNVPPAQYNDAKLVINQINIEWHYKLAGDERYNICGATPESKMAIAGADYADNPVTQLNYCNLVVMGRYGSWAAALPHAMQYHSII